MSERPRPQRKSPRLEGYDYGQEGAYFVTICTYQRVHLFGDVIDGEMRLSALGQIAFDTWLTIPDHYPHVILDAFVVMPNHMHGIVYIVDEARSKVGLRRASTAAPLPQIHSNSSRSRTLSTVIGAYKSAVTRGINQQMGLQAPKVWQASFHDHIIRSERTLAYIRNYIDTNPGRWEQDSFYS